MAKFYFIRHGKPDYTYGDTHGFIGQGHDFAPLKTEKIEEVIEAAKDKRLKDVALSDPASVAVVAPPPCDCMESSPLMTIRGASSVMEPPLLTVTDEGPTAVTAPPGVIST